MPGAKLMISPLQLIFRSTTCLLQCKPVLQSKFLLRNLSFGSVRKSSSKDIAERPLSEEKKSDDKPEPTSHGELSENCINFTIGLFGDMLVVLLVPSLEYVGHDK